MSLHRSLQVAAILTISSVTQCYARSDAAASSCRPDEVVRQVLADARPLKQPPCWKIMTLERLNTLALYLEKPLRAALRQWIDARERLSELGPSAEASYDPLTYRRWQPEVQTITRPDYFGDSATVIVREQLQPSRIYSGYKGRSIFTFKKVGGKWVLQNVEFKRKYSTGLMEDSHLLTLLYEQAATLRKLADPSLLRCGCQSSGRAVGGEREEPTGFAR